MASDRLGDRKLLEEKFLSAIKIGDGGPKEEFQFKCLDRFGDYLNLNWELNNSHDHVKDNSEKGSLDVRDLLPSDPFGMDLSARFTSITWIEEMDKDFGLSNFGFGNDEKTEVKKTGDDLLFAGMNLVWKGSMKIYPEAGDNKTDGNSVGPAMSKDSVDGKIEELRNFSYERYWVSGDEGEEVQECKTNYSDGDAGAPPPEALFYALGHLGVRDLLSVERVCKTLCDAVRDDPLLWRTIHIDQPLSKRITDDSLLQMTSRAKRSLKCLSLVQCSKITDSGIERVLQSNPGLTKLSVPGCVRLSMDGILSNLKSLKSAGLPGIKKLRIGGRFGVTQKHFEELKCMLAVDNDHFQQLSTQKPRFYGGGQLYLSFDDDRAIDVEACPRCQQITQVYDCPAESCQSKKHTCRGCTCCIPRCNTCGCCVSDRDFVEAFCLDLHCLDCWKQIMSYQEINYFYFCG